MDFACGSGSLLLNVRKRMGPHGIGKIYGQEKNITTYNLARMNMLLHGVKDTEFEIFHGDTLANEWDKLRELNPAKQPKFDAIVANPPFSLRWEPSEAMADDFRFKGYGGLAPKSAADFAFLLHGFHFLKDEGVMAIILPHGVLFRGGAEERIRTKLLKDGHIDTVIGLPSNLFYSTGIPVCILVLKKCKKPDDVLFINAAEHFVKGKRQNQLTDEHIAKIIKTYQFREEEARYSRRVEMAEIEKNDFNLNISPPPPRPTSPTVNLPSPPTHSLNAYFTCISCPSQSHPLPLAILLSPADPCAPGAPLHPPPPPPPRPAATTTPLLVPPSSPSPPRPAEALMALPHDDVAQRDPRKRKARRPPWHLTLMMRQGQLDRVINLFGTAPKDQDHQSQHAA